MELRHIRYFLAIAEEKNFTRAAARLGIGQPPLSQQIRDLEREVGTPLFHRVPHGAELTEAGRAFWEVVSRLPPQVTEAIHAAQRAARGETGALRLGFTGTAVLNPVVPACIREFRRHYPQVEIRLMETNSALLVQALVEKRLDVAIVRPAEGSPPTVVHHLLTAENLVAALPAAHPAAREGGAADTGIALASLKDDPFILTPRSIGSSLHDTVLASCRAAGFTPTQGQAAPQIASMLSLVSAELGVALVPESMQQLKVHGVVYRPIGGGAPPRVSLSVAHLDSQTLPQAHNFVALAQSLGSGEKSGEP